MLVGDGWMGGCSGLTSINFSALKNLKEVGKYWMGNCTRLTSINFSGLNNLKEVGNINLEFIKKYSMFRGNRNNINVNCMLGCSSLNTIILGEHKLIQSLLKQHEQIKHLIYYKQLNLMQIHELTSEFNIGIELNVPSWLGNYRV